MPLVSVITPCYKAMRYIGRTIESVQKQTLTYWKLIVVEDGSPDDGAAIIRTYADVAALPDTSEEQRRILRLAYRQWWSDIALEDSCAFKASLRQKEALPVLKDFARTARNFSRSLRGLLPHRLVPNSSRTSLCS